eukprot:gene5034-6264_t
MVLLDNESFLNSLHKLYQTSKEKGSVWVTMKNYVNSDSNPGLKKPDRVPVQPGEEENKCLMRACNGKKKISTIVLAKDIVTFQQSYKNILLVNFDNLKKVPKDKKKQPTQPTMKRKVQQ